MTTNTLLMLATTLAIYFVFTGERKTVPKKSSTISFNSLNTAFTLGMVLSAIPFALNFILKNLEVNSFVNSIGSNSMLIFFLIANKDALEYFERKLQNIAPRNMRKTQHTLKAHTVWAQQQINPSGPALDNLNNDIHVIDVE